MGQVHRPMANVVSTSCHMSERVAEDGAITSPPQPSPADWLLEQIADDERGAQAAIDPKRPGTHWHWATRQTGRLVPVDAIEKTLKEGEQVCLRTVEEFPTRSGVGYLCAFPIWAVAEGEGLPGAMTHMAMWDPARVLAECEVKRRIVELHKIEATGVECLECGPTQRRGACQTILLLAGFYRERAGYREEWRP